MLTVYLCDDNPAILQLYKKRLLQLSAQYEVPINLFTFSSGTQLLFHLEDDWQKVDIIYLDILMGDENGIEVAKKLRARDCSAEIIFLTANPEYVFDSFDVSPLNYILKDNVTDERFQEIFFNAAIRVNKKVGEKFCCSNSNGTIKKQIPFSDISFFEVSNRIVTVHYSKEIFSFYKSMEALVKELHNKGFIRTHRSYLINISYIEQITKNSISLITGETVPLGVTYSQNVKMNLNQFLNTFR